MEIMRIKSKDAFHSKSRTTPNSQMCNCSVILIEPTIHQSQWSIDDGS